MNGFPLILITPVYKKNYSIKLWPISLTTICCKIMEHIIYIMEHLNQHNYLEYIDFNMAFPVKHNWHLLLDSLHIILLFLQGV